VDYQVDLWIDALNRPRRIEYETYFWAEPDQLTLEFWDFDGDFTVAEPEGLHAAG